MVPFPAMKPSIGRLVHYTLPDLRISPAIITEVNPDGSVDLELFGDKLRVRQVTSVKESPAAGAADAVKKWSWPERV